jgi:hypothetical protein
MTESNEINLQNGLFFFSQEKLKTFESIGSGDRRMEETRRGVAKLVVADGGQPSQASKIVGTMTSKARAGWEKIKRLMEGKRVVSRDDDGMVLMDGEELGAEEGLLEKAEWDEEVMGGVVEVKEEVRSEDRTEDSEGGEENRWGGTGEFGFLENVEIHRGEGQGTG